jgi:polyvinyl alcohol dehydrogenase (cytochrome)
MHTGEQMKGADKLLAVLTLGFGFAAAHAQAPVTETHPGQQVYESFCAFCHEGGDPRAATLATLRSMNADALHFTLSNGLMMAQAQSLTREQRDAVIDYLAAPPASRDWIDANLCAGLASGITVEPLMLASAGGNLQFSRELTAAQSGLQKAAMPTLELAWAVAFPGVSGLRSSPAVAGNTLFYPAGSTGLVLAMDTQSGCIKWVYDAGASLRSSATLADADIGDARLLFVTDERAQIHAINAYTGEGIWRVSGEVDADVHTRLTGAPVYFEQRLYVPVSASGVQRGAVAEHECCDGRGAVLALDAASGGRLWTYLTMPEATYTGALNAVGARLRGPSGAPIWSSPGLDRKRRQLYITTGENTSLPATDTSNAIIALDIDSGAVRWQFQAIPNDVWNMACTGRNPGPNCPSPADSIIKDWDFGGAAVLVQLSDGSERLVAGQKSGHLWGLDPDTGDLVWEQRVGQGGALGGNHWGIAIDDTRVLMPINDPNTAGLSDDVIRAGVYAFDVATGEPLWEYRARPDCTNGRDLRVEGCQLRYGFSAMPLVIDGALVAGNIDGRLFVFDGTDGSVLFEFDTAMDFRTVNDVAGRGGSIDAHSIAAGDGMIFVGSGYDRFRQQNGNVLLAFRPAAQNR